MHSNTCTITALHAIRQRNVAQSPRSWTCIPFRSPKKMQPQANSDVTNPPVCSEFSAPPIGGSGCSSVNRHRKFLCPRWNLSGFFSVPLHSKPPFRPASRNSPDVSTQPHTRCTRYPSGRIYRKTPPHRTDLTTHR